MKFLYIKIALHAFYAHTKYKMNMFRGPLIVNINNFIQRKEVNRHYEQTKNNKVMFVQYSNDIDCFSAYPDHTTVRQLVETSLT